MKSKIDLRNLLNLPTSLFEKFHVETQYTKLPSTPLHPTKWPNEWKVVQYKSYYRLKEIILPKPILPKKSFSGILFRRRSDRNFLDKRLTLSQLSSVLYFSAGLRLRKSLRVDNRFYPSAGARYPLEIYCLLLNTTLPRGLYHYYVKNNSLEELMIFKKIDYKRYFNQNWISKSAMIIFITAVFKRTTIKYGNFGYRHIFIEAGHLGQNMYLLSSALNIKCCSIGAYIDKSLNTLLDIDGLNESVVYALAFGH